MLKKIISPPSSSFGFRWVGDKKGSFSIYAPKVSHVKLTLYPLENLNTPFQSIEEAATGIICFTIDNLPPTFAYSWSLIRENVASPEFADPWNPLLAGSHAWKSSARYDRSLAMLTSSNQETDLLEQPTLCDLRIYECHVRAASQRSTKESSPGTYEALISIIDHVKDCGFNAIELLPIQEFDEQSISSPNDTRVNYWGYMPLHPQTLMRGYSAKGQSLDAEQSFQTFVKRAHEQDIRVILDLVFNHLDSKCPMSYCLGDELWLKNSSGHPVDYTGCGNTVNCQHPIVREWIRSQLYYWVYKLGVDGFRFDLACALYRQTNGSLVFEGSLLHQLRQDPWLKDRIWINEPWDAAGAWDLGQTARWGFLEWNDRYRDDIRSYIHFGQRKDLAATRMCGSSDLFNNEKSLIKNPIGPIQYIACHDGFCLQDLVSYNERHNLSNGENGRDGHSHNISFNYGVEGNTEDKLILEIREQQVKNFMTFLAVSKGPIMLLAGDEYGHTRQGNNNPWCQDNELNALDLEKISQNPPLLLFWKKLMKWRQMFSLFHPEQTWDSQHVIWHGVKLESPNWHQPQGPLAVELRSKDSCAFAIFNPTLFSQKFDIPQGHNWHIVTCSNLVQIEDLHVTLGSRSSLLLSDINPA